ncbi:MAG: response regulator [Bacteroidetes bacterium]|nr:response regulator [Bacteroidota bacterium]
MLKSIIIDDETESIEVLKSLLTEYCQDVFVIGTANSPAEGIKLIKQNPPDLLFLDIDMPGLNGFELLKTLPEKDFEIISVTAHNDKALEAFKA